jgi:hypothetical protein
MRLKCSINTQPDKWNRAQIHLSGNPTYQDLARYPVHVLKALMVPYPTSTTNKLQGCTLLRLYRECRDSARLSRFCGCTRMIPLPGLSMSAMRKSDMESAMGKTRERKLLLSSAP